MPTIAIRTAAGWQWFLPEAYNYDRKGQISQAQRGSSTTEAYTWDAAGNRTSAIGAPGWSSDGSDRLTTTTTTSLSYDARGNLTSKVDGSTAWGYQWDAEDRLVSVSKNGMVVAAFTYDPLGRRTTKTSGGTTTSYVYDGANLLQETTGSSVTLYTHGPGMTSLSQPRRTRGHGTITRTPWGVSSR